ncbi:sugar ABC transporter substrate-binding protein [Oleiagrimonas soli]|uniref:ABC transporter substrate-binding protein n=1 Tax=Oleiagrimonas soli TaxID=1543381 RepID=A0A099D1C6_9GAMM|nr:sugar ABC transporter substrate-binding protein [Oleiagrimonas soli]KGI79090.1 ABC transporter substrate-binding protein [Oleiagrimonas soli]MBB6184699.1 multiple sugar transport system substrate-binding protein [Oleiagrimonas soli]
MRLWRARGWHCAALLAVALLLCACRHAAPPATQTVTFWAMGREGESVRRLMPAFEREHPDIRVRVEILPWKAAHQKLLTAFAGDVTPDLCQLGNTWVPELAALGALQPLGAQVRASKSVDPDDYFPGIWDTNRIDGTLYGVPWYVDTRLLFYRKDLLAKAGFDHPPRSWGEWARQMAAIKAMVGPSRYAVLLPLNEFEQLESLGLQQPQSMLRDGGRYGNFQSPGFKRALRFYSEIFRNDWAPKVTNAEASNPWAEFGRGYFAFYVSGPWNIEEFKNRLPASQQGDWATAPLPGPDGPGTSLAGGASLVIFRASRHKQAAWKLIEYLSRPDVQRTFYQLVGDMPPRRSAWDNSALADDPHAHAFRVQLERARPVPKVPEWERIAAQLALVEERMAHGQLSVDQAAQLLNARADAILAKRRWVLAHEPSKAPERSP